MKKNGKPEFALCLNNDGYPVSLEIGKVYRIVRDADESGEDYALPRADFTSSNCQLRFEGRSSHAYSLYSITPNLFENTTITHFPPRSRHASCSRIPDRQSIKTTVANNVPATQVG